MALAYTGRLEEKGSITRKGNIVDASFVEVPRQRNRRAENESIKRGEVPDGWEDVLRDMGYFSLSEFNAIELLEAWWLTRLPLITGVMLTDGRSLEKYLKSFRGANRASS